MIKATAARGWTPRAAVAEALPAVRGLALEHADDLLGLFDHAADAVGRLMRDFLQLGDQCLRVLLRRTGVALVGRDPSLLEELDQSLAKVAAEELADLRLELLERVSHVE